VKKVCEVAEQCVQHAIKTKGPPRLQGNLVQALSSTVLKIVSERYPSCLEEISSHTDPMNCCIVNNHWHEVIKAVAIHFIKLRLHHVAKLHTEKIQVYSCKLCYFVISWEVQILNFNSVSYNFYKG
jgi:hypothetical protein